MLMILSLGDWQGEARFKLTFKSGGAVTVGQALIKIAKQG